VQNGERKSKGIIVKERLTYVCPLFVSSSPIAAVPGLSAAVYDSRSHLVVPGLVGHGIELDFDDQLVCILWDGTGKKKEILRTRK
jgi:hypothetical protein